MAQRTSVPWFGVSHRAPRVAAHLRILLGAELATVAALSVGLVGCGAEPAHAAESVPLFSVALPELADKSYEREYVGEVHAIRYAEIRSRLKGFIESVPVDEGQAVKADQLLFSIRARELQQEVLKARAVTMSAQAELKLAQLEQQNTQMLFEKQVVSNAEMALAQSKIDALDAKLAESKANESQTAIQLAYGKLRAPFNGVVNRIPHKVGSTIAEDELLTTLADTSEVFVYFRVSEREYLEYTSGAAASRPKAVALKLADGSIHPQPGTIDAVESEVDRETGNIAFRARFPNPAGMLKHGSSGKVVITTDVAGALVVPQKSTFEVQGSLYVYALDQDNTARARAIVPKMRLGDSFLVASGLTPQDRFILEGIQKVKDGDRVQTLPPN